MSGVITRLIMLSGLAVSLSACDWPWQSKTPEGYTQQEQIWLIVPAATSGPIMAVWRINTKTGLMDFCFNNGGIQCNPSVYAPVDDRQKTSEKLKDDSLWQMMNTLKRP